ncbi:hypothetical protein BGW41_002549 [Actinomortierella wolfii]|nr:hypothetical protein BGW41_002549 [Actinomortierella wolfii]
MKLSLIAITTLAAVALAQNTTEPSAECAVCVDMYLQEAPECAGKGISFANLGNMDPSKYLDFLVCFCSIVDGSFMNPCETVCGSDLGSYKDGIKKGIDALQQLGMQCGSTTPTSIPPPASSVVPSKTGSVAPSATGSSTPTPTGKGGPRSDSTRLMAPLAASLVTLAATMAFQLL